jgi:hypothetical protein
MHADSHFDADDDGTQTGLNPTLILQGDLAVRRIVTGDTFLFYEAFVNKV